VQRRQELGERDNAVAVHVVDAEDVAAEAIGVTLRVQLVVDCLELARTHVTSREVRLELLVPLVDLGVREVGAFDQFVKVFRRQILLALRLAHLRRSHSSALYAKLVISGSLHVRKIDFL